jgi:ribosomal protein L11 methyltransferase
MKAPRLLDLGTGSGILGIAAVKAMGARVLATDIDDRAVRIANENARRNGVAARMRCFEAHGVNHPRIRAEAPFDVVVANILAEPLIELAGRLAHLLAPKGVLILSGVLGREWRAVFAHYRLHSFHLRSWALREGWASLELVGGERKI